MLRDRLAIHGMARPRKNRIGEYAGLLGDELELHLARAVTQAVAEGQRAYEAEIAILRGEIRELGRRLDALSHRPAQRRAALGRWVPGGPGRPPKDAADRVAAFAARGQKKRGPKRPG
jgi:hypothetical protein